MPGKWTEKSRIQCGGMNIQRTLDGIGHNKHRKQENDYEETI